MQQLMGTKFITTIGCGLVTSVLCWYGKISDDVFAMVILGTVGAFIAGDVIQKRAEAMNDNP